MAEPEAVYCTMVLSDSYLPGVAVLVNSLRDTGCTRPLACLLTPDSLSRGTIEALLTLCHPLIPVSRIGTPHPNALHLMARPDLLYAYTKLHLWSLTQYRRILYLDADVLALRSPEPLFDLPHTFAAAPDVGWPDIFNTGVMLLTPDAGVHRALRTLAASGDSFDGADQGLLNQYYEGKGWGRLSFGWNCTPSAGYQYEPAYMYFKQSVGLVHFIGREKPWTRGREGLGETGGAYRELLGRWWAVFERYYGEGVEAREVVRAVRRGVRGVVVGGVRGQEVPAEALVTTTEAPFTEPGERAENLQQGVVEPPSTVDVRRFSAPHVEWDATRAAPPPSSKPEAANLQSTTYTFSTNPQPFRPPPSTTPSTTPKPPSIFPWESRPNKPTRRFIEDELPPAPKPAPAPVLAPSPLEDELAVQSSSPPAEEGSLTSPTTPTIRLNDHHDFQQPQSQPPNPPWPAIGAAGRNAWDDVRGIESYVRALSDAQQQRSHSRNQSNTSSIAPMSRPSSSFGPAAGGPTTQARNGSEQQHVFTAANAPESAQLVDAVRARRESLRLTDFPSATERPSLPVTPAPIRRGVFWGRGTKEGPETADESDDDAEPEAEADPAAHAQPHPRQGSALVPVPAAGVPEQADWDPNAQLEQLRRNSLLSPTGELPSPTEGRELSKRALPATASRTAGAGMLGRRMGGDGVGEEREEGQGEGEGDGEGEREGAVGDAGRVVSPTGGEGEPLASPLPGESSAAPLEAARVDAT